MYFPTWLVLEFLSSIIHLKCLLNLVLVLSILRSIEGLWSSLAFSTKGPRLCSFSLNSSLSFNSYWQQLYYSTSLHSELNNQTVDLFWVSWPEEFLLNTSSPISQQVCYSKISLHSRNRQVPKNQLNANSETAQKDKTYKTGTRLWVKLMVSCTPQTSLLQRTKTKFNKWIIPDKNSGTNHAGKYIESLSF